MTLISWFLVGMCFMLIDPLSVALALIGCVVSLIFANMPIQYIVLNAFIMRILLHIFFVLYDVYCENDIQIIVDQCGEEIMTHQ